MFSSFIIVAFATLLVLLFLRPREPERTAQPRAENAHHRPGPGVVDNSHTTNHATTSSNKSSKRTVCTKTPSHLAPSIVAHSGGANVLADGLVGFKYTSANSSTTSADASLRKDRARILTRLLMDGNETINSNIVPPSKGGTMLISIPSSDVGCESLARVLFLLATYYNVFLLVSVTGNDTSDTKKDAATIQQEQKALVDKLYTGDLTRRILPPHRVVPCSTVAGRVAFARQLQRMEMVLDYESEVDTSLSRFGYKVVLYNKNTTMRSDCGTSMLGQKLR